MRGRARGSRTALALACLLLAPAAGAADGQDQRYLGDAAPDLVAVLPPAPLAGTPRYETDRKVFRQTRKLAGTPRWQAATEDVKVDVPAMLRNFSCAAGVAMTGENAPRTAALLARLRKDVSHGVSAPKRHYQRKRPFLIDPGPICQPRAELETSFDYPSGHTSWGWAVALTLAEADPPHAGAILARGRAYGESRIVCGAHNASAVEAGRTTAASVVAALHGVPEFRDDVAAARAEIRALRDQRQVPDAASCQAEISLLGPSPY